MQVLLAMVLNQSREKTLELVTLSNNPGIWFQTSQLMFVKWKYINYESYKGLALDSYTPVTLLLSQTFKRLAVARSKHWQMYVWYKNMTVFQTTYKIKQNSSCLLYKNPSEIAGPFLHMQLDRASRS
jgi:hypothetical protein